jgi:hypothetical protein
MMPPALGIALRVEFRANRSVEFCTNWRGEFPINWSVEFRANWCGEFRVDFRIMAIALLGRYTPPAGEMFRESGSEV